MRTQVHCNEKVAMAYVCVVWEAYLNTVCIKTIPMPMHPLVLLLVVEV